MSEPSSANASARSVASAAGESIPPHPNPLPRVRRRGDQIAACALGLAWTIVCAFRLHDDALIFAFAGMLGVVVAVPLAAGRGYAIAAAMIALGVALVSGPRAAIVTAAVAFSLWGGVELLAAIRVPRTVGAIAQLLFGLALLTWPIWAANLLLRFDVQPLVDWATYLGPLFAVNRAVDPTDAFTHRPWSYRWMNLGQDVPYALPPTVWPCVALHASIGVAGLVARRLCAVAPTIRGA